MGRYVFQPMSYSEYLSKFINGLKTGELLVNLQDHDIYVTEEGFNVPVPIISPLRNEIIKYLENDLEGIKTRMSLNPAKIDRLFKMKSEMEEEQQNIYGRIRDLQSDERYIRNKYLFINKITEYNVNQLGDLTFNIKDYDDSLTNYIGEINKLSNIFNDINNDCSSYDKLYQNRNKELEQIWSFIDNIYKEMANRINKFKNLEGNMKIYNYSSREIDIYDVYWNRRLNRFQEGFGDYNLRGSSNTLSYIKDNKKTYMNYCLDVTSRYKAFMSRHSELQHPNLSIDEFHTYTGTNILYPGFMNKVDLNGNNNTKIARHYYPFDCFELPAFTKGSDYNTGKNIYNDIINKYDGFKPDNDVVACGIDFTSNSKVDDIINYIRSASNNVLPYIYGDYSDANKNGFAKKCKASNTPSQSTAYNTTSWGKKLNIYNNVYDFDIKEYHGGKLGFLNKDITKFSPKQYLPKYMCGINNSSSVRNGIKDLVLFNREVGGKDNRKEKSTLFGKTDVVYTIYSHVLPSVARCVTQSWAGHGGREYIASSTTHNSDAIIFRIGLVKKFKETVITSSANLKYDNSKGWVRKK